MSIEETLTKTRSYRRFYQEKAVTQEQLSALIRCASLTPSGGNKMPLKYITSRSPESNRLIFDCLGWAAYLPDWPGPEEGERPAAYLVMLRDSSIAKATATDEGLQAMAVMLAATEAGLGGCIMANIQREKLAAALGISQPYEIALVLALGYPKESVVIEEVGKDGNVKYWRDGNKVHHVPKRTAQELLLKAL